MKAARFYTHPHGTRSRYQAGYPGRECRAANAAYQKDRGERHEVTARSGR
ncbi:MAG: hypothetical protein ACRDOK_17870 [Streptosporangiaceae bacterium]